MIIQSQKISLLAVLLYCLSTGLALPAKGQELSGSSKETVEALGRIRHINAGVLNVGYAESGPAEGPAVILLHGWPYDIHSFSSVAPILARKGFRVIVPYLRGFGSTVFLSARTFRNGQQSALAVDVIELMDALQIRKAVIGGFDWGARTADIVAALWPERCIALVSVSGYLIGSPEAGKKPLLPEAEQAWWYQFYFATKRGETGYRTNRIAMAKLIWQNASPHWKFSDSTFNLSARSFENKDHVDIVIHNYRWRIGAAKGESRYAGLEKRLKNFPVISVPAISIEGDDNGAPHPDPKSYARMFTGRYMHRTVLGGIGHNLPSEAPEAFAQAVSDAYMMAQ
ncbi:alpha/beta fold hydrolase [Mucilaginibacter pallidiroseus]|nr:alpha/beta hydrolase [Mucilaginibacter pallidiroseus]